MRSVIVIGPPGAGKSILSERLSARTGLRYRSLDAERDHLGSRFGFSAPRAERIYVNDGAQSYAQYTNRFDAAVLADWLRRDQPSVIDTSGALMTEAHRLLGSDAALGHAWVMVWPPNAEDLTWWSQRTDDRAGNSDWWSRGGDALQDVAIEAGRRLLGDRRVMVVAGLEDTGKVINAIS